ncbi:uncharacterized protein A4U43_C07F32390 [Asparagus officinalis]|uniref:Uncharacterized protein n=1 Tax=Asparagus officinalis TaxID=4686 RepID=A0A5P1EIH6_ASPOF|nr:uncharacterized protein A4U43_C07F32390 [Asparagus officinalis]
MSYMNILNSPSLYLQPGHSSQDSDGVLKPSFDKEVAGELAGTKRNFIKEVKGNSLTKQKKRVSKERRISSNDISDMGSKGSGGYNKLVLDKLYDKLFRDENEARYFIGKSVESRSRYLAMFVKDNGLEVEMLKTFDPH